MCGVSCVHCARIAHGPPPRYASQEIASTVKMLQNSIIGPVAIAVTIYWVAFVEKTKQRKRATCCDRALEIWNRFPKFVLGFLIVSVVVTLVKSYAPRGQGLAFEDLLIATRSWWFTIGFVGVGLTTNLKSMYRRLKGGKAVLLYCLGQGFDLLFTYAVSYLAFAVLYKGSFGE